MLASMGTPTVPDYVNIIFWINIEQLIKKFSNDKTVFPVIKGIMPFSCMNIASHKQIAYAFYFLSVRHMVIASKNIFLPAILFYCSLSFFIKGKQYAVLRKICNSLLYCKFFLSKSLSGEYCHRLLLFSLAPASSRICLTFSMLIESTTL